MKKHIILSASVALLAPAVTAFAYTTLEVSRVPIANGQEVRSLTRSAPGPVVLAADQGHGRGDHAMAMEPVRAGDLEITAPMIRATPPNAPVSAGYMVIRNTGSQPDRLVGASAEFAGKVEIHEMRIEGDVMKMREIEGGLEIPPGGEVKLESGGLHVMFMQLDRQMKEGEMHNVTLEFENAGAVELVLPVMKIEKAGHGSH